MIRRPLRLVILLTGLALTSGYLWLNQGKALKAIHDLRLDLAGKPSSTWALALDKQVLISRRLPPTGIFDGAGLHQINIEPIPKHLYQRIREARDRVTQVYDDKAQTSRLIARENFLVTQIADRRVYLVRQEDARTIASIVWNERRRIRDVVRCQDPALCKDLRIVFEQGWGPLSGPYLNSDINPGRRGMPRGRWASAPASQITILAREDNDVVLHLKMLRIAPDQAIRINGRPLQPTGKTAKRALALGGKIFYPAVYTLPIHLQKGRNQLRLESSQWISRQRGAKGGLSSYLLAMAVDSAQNPAANGP